MSIILDEYRIGFVPSKVGAGDIFARRESRVLFLAVRSTHKVSSVFPDDCRKIGKLFRRVKPDSPEVLERLLWTYAKDEACKCPWRPCTAPVLSLSRPETKDEFDARIERVRKDWLALIEELRCAMNGTRVPAVKFVIIKP